MPDKIYSLNVPPGIQSDGTPFAARCWIDGLWTRFQRGLPRKIGGYVEIATTTDIVRGTFVVPNPPNFLVFYGTDPQLFVVPINSDPSNPFTLGPPVNITPVGYTADANNDWSFDTMYSAALGTSILVAFAAPNLASIANTIERPIFYGPLTSENRLISNNFSVSGGIVVLHPFLFAFGNNGQVTWFEPNDPTTIRNSAIVAGEKIVAGIPTRGGTNSPAGIFWSLTSVIRCTYNGISNVDFNFDAVASQSSLLSSRSIIEYDNLYYWCGVDRFLFYNGTVQELPNDKNINFFFDNLNYSQRQKVWATKTTRFGEIWWHFPYGNSTECNAAVIYNVREKSWYKTFFDIGMFNGRSDGYFDQTYSKPIWASTNDIGTANTYPLFVHETGVDAFYNNAYVSIESYITSPAFTFAATAIDNSRPETDLNYFITKVEPDFVMPSGTTMTFSIYGNEFANSPDVLLESQNFTNITEHMDYTVMGREIYFEIVCDGLGCDYQMGQILISAKPGDARP
jgi:hypothetical protein